MKRWTFIVLFTAAMTGVFYYGLVYFTSNGEEEKRPLRTGEATTGDLRVAIAASGVIKPFVEVEVKSKAGGEIVSFPFNEGDIIERGRTVVKLDPDNEKSRVNQARADLLMAEGKLEKAGVSLSDTELKLERKEKLFAKGIISRQEYDDAIMAHKKEGSELTIANASLIKATEGVKEAEDRLRDTKIKAPITGTILLKLVEEGQVISSTLSSASEGTALFTMADLDRLYVKAMVDEVDIGLVAPGQSVLITVDSWPSKEFSGEVTRISPKGRLERTVTVFDVVVEIIDEEKTSLKPGMTANAEIVTDLIYGATLVPSEAVRKKAGKTGVYKVTGVDAEWTPVDAGKTDGIRTEIRSGLLPGDKVVLNGMGGGKKKDKKKKRWLH